MRSSFVFTPFLALAFAAASAAGCAADDSSGEDVGEGRDAIVGGSFVQDIHTTPWTAVLKNSDFAKWWDPTAEVASGMWCGATVVAPQYVITGAHCVTKADAKGNLTIIRPAKD